METNGKVSVMPKASAAPVTNEDLKTQAEDSFLPIVLVSDGKIIKENIALAGVSQEEVTAIVKENSNTKNNSIKDVLLLTINKTGQAYLQMKKGEGLSFQSKRLVSE